MESALLIERNMGNTCLPVKLLRLVCGGKAPKIKEIRYTTCEGVFDLILLSRPSVDMSAVARFRGGGA